MTAGSFPTSLLTVCESIRIGTDRLSSSGGVSGTANYWSVMSSLFKSYLLFLLCCSRSSLSSSFWYSAFHALYGIYELMEVFE